MARPPSGNDFFFFRYKYSPNITGNKIFDTYLSSGFASQASEIAAQPVGFEFAIQSAEERINNLRGSGKIHPQQPVVAIENFIVNFMENM